MEQVASPPIGPFGPPQAIIEYVQNLLTEAQQLHVSMGDTVTAQDLKEWTDEAMLWKNKMTNISTQMVHDQEQRSNVLLTQGILQLRQTSVDQINLQMPAAPMPLRRESQPKTTQGEVREELAAFVMRYSNMQAEMWTMCLPDQDINTATAAEWQADATRLYKRQEQANHMQRGSRYP